jgi:acetyltransferase-like isoleucine patch superfamily enzyme
MSEAPDWHHLPANRWNPHAWILGEPDIGPGCWIGAFCVLDGSGGLTIGAGCDIASGAQIYTHSTVLRCLTGGAADVSRAPTTIGARTHVGAGAIVLMGVSIGERSIVAAGAVVTAHTVAPPASLLVGVPARVVPGGAASIAEAKPGHH